MLEFISQNTLNLKEMTLTTVKFPSDYPDFSRLSHTKLNLKVFSIEISRIFHLQNITQIALQSFGNDHDHEADLIEMARNLRNLERIETKFDKQISNATIKQVVQLLKKLSKFHQILKKFNQFHEKDYNEILPDVLARENHLQLTISIERNYCITSVRTNLRRKLIILNEHSDLSIFMWYHYINF